MWQTLREELYPEGLEIVTVALDTGGVAAAGPWIEAAHPSHPSLIDQAHLLDDLLGIVNVPSGVWINEEGVIVRPPETAYPRRPAFLDREIPAGASAEVIERFTEVKKLQVDAEKYVSALRDWVVKGAASRFALSSEEVLNRSRPRPIEEALAAAHFELAQHFQRSGQEALAIPHFRAAHQLYPDNWTYKRQAWSLIDPGQGPSEVYEGDWMSDVKKIGGENYYAPLQM